MRLAGKRALVTGGASGIGAATAARFAAEGAAVAIADLNGPGADEQAEAIREQGGTALGIAADVGDADSVAAMMDRAWEALGSVDILVNNAAIPTMGTVETLAGEEWDRVIDLDLSSIYRVSRAAWPRFVDAGGGAILNTASVAGLIGMAGQHGYSAAKAGVVMLTKCMALDGAAHGIRVNCVCPGFVETPMVLTYFEAQDDPVASRAAVDAAHPLGRARPARRDRGRLPLSRVRRGPLGHRHGARDRWRADRRTAAGVAAGAPFSGGWRPPRVGTDRPGRRP